MWLVAIAAITPTILAGYVFLHRDRIYTRWAKCISIIAAVGGLVWGGSKWVLWHWRSWHLTHDTYYGLVGYGGLVGGLTWGLLICILIARPYQKKDVAKPAV
jgi:TRAP-type C4-dicarboxylate transport system permease small subunit